MQLATSQQYLVRLNESLIYHFFLDRDQSLHYNTYNNNNILLNSNELLSDIIDFSVTVDKHEKIHLICITRKGELLYYISKNNNWSHKVISKFDIKSNVYKYLMLYIHDEYTHILYIKTNLLTQALSAIEHIYWCGKNVNRIVVNNYIHGKYTSPFQMSIDSAKNIHLIYKVYHTNNHQLYYSRFNPLTGRWASGELITNIQENHSHPYLFIDKQDDLHLVWCTIEQNNFILKYKRKPSAIYQKSKWSDPQILSSKNSNSHSPILIQESNSLKIYCKQNDQIIEIISNDFGDSWIKSTNDKPYSIEEPKIIQYSSNLQSDDKYLVKHIYGNVKDKIDLAGINLFNNGVQNQLSPIHTPRLESNDKTYEIEQPNNKSNTEDESTDVLTSLLSSYNNLEKRLVEIEEEKQKLTRSTTNHEIDLNLLEEKIVDYKKQMLIFQDKLDVLITNNSMFKRFINFFK